MTNNDILKCQFCKTEIKKWATTCPNCKKDLRWWFNRHPIIYLSIIIMTIVIIWNNNENNTSSNENNLPTSWSCPSDIKKLIKNYYKSPSTVNFLSCDYTKDWDIYTFVWNVDSQNSFWATVRSSFVCKWDSKSDNCEIFQK